MARILLPIPADPSLIHRVIVDQGDPLVEVFNDLYAGLVPDPVSGYLLIDDDAIDNSQERYLSYKTTIGERSSHPLRLRAELPDADSLTIHIYTEDAGLGAVEGLEFGAVPVSGFVSAGQKKVVKEVSVFTDQAGFAQLLLRGGVGDYNLVLGRLRGKVTVTDQEGLDINVKDAGWTEGP